MVIYLFWLNIKHLGPISGCCHIVLELSVRLTIMFRSSIFSNDFTSEDVRPKLLIFGIKHPQEGGIKNVVFVLIG